MYTIYIKPIVLYVPLVSSISEISLYYLINFYLLTYLHHCFQSVMPYSKTEKIRTNILIKWFNAEWTLDSSRLVTGHSSLSNHTIAREVLLKARYNNVRVSCYRFAVLYIMISLNVILYAVRTSSSTLSNAKILLFLPSAARMNLIWLILKLVQSSSNEYIAFFSQP